MKTYTKLYLDTDCILSKLPEEYNDSDIEFLDVKIANHGKEIEFVCEIKEKKTFDDYAYVDFGRDKTNIFYRGKLIVLCDASAKDVASYICNRISDETKVLVDRRGIGILLRDECQKLGVNVRTLDIER